MIVHVVMMKFKDGTTDNQIAEIEQGLDALPDRIHEIQSYEFGRDMARSERSYDFALVSVFANLDTLKHYQEHPEHLKVVTKIRAACADIRAVDYETDPLPAPPPKDPLFE
ncbi:MAG: Dabb family protein [Desulfobacterales bacterium]|nr:Dabb family protein [Desulfobacterales bacterium]